MKRSFDRMASPIAAVIVLAAVVTTACTGGQALPSERPASTPPASLPPAPSAAPSSASASSSPSPTLAPLIWTTASLKEDWPAPVRTEPAGPTTILPILNKTVFRDCPGPNCSELRHERGHYVDPTGDTGSDAFPWIDIDGVGFCGSACLTPGLASRDLPLVGPTEQWMAYGVVFDTDGDGVADWRYGVDNLSPDMRHPEGERPHRAWRTNLHTGRTESAAGPPYGTPIDTYYPGRWTFGGDAAGGGFAGMKLDMPFYVWASEIKDGRVVATDYAPDVGWLLASPEAQP